MFRAKYNEMLGWIVVNANGYIAEDGIATEKEAKRIAKWMNENN